MHSLNMQDKEPRTNRTDGAVEIVDLFYTIQGEGPFAGRPAVFVRLAGCNLRCPDCDTDYTSKRRYVSSDLLVANIRSMADTPKHRPRLVVITGGEPFRQNITPLLEGIKSNLKALVQIETNGTFFPETMPDVPVTVVISPKTERIHPLWEKRMVCYKYIVESGRVCPEDGLPTSVLGNGIRPARPPIAESRPNVYVQPADVQNEEANKANIDEAVRSCLKFGYTLSLQTHKIIGLP